MSTSARSLPGLRRTPVAGVAAAAGARPSLLLTAGIYAAIVLIVVADWLTPAGVVVSILLVVPILFTSVTSDPAAVWRVTALALVLKVAAAIFGAGAISPAAVWLPNRVFTMLIIPCSGVVAAMLQRRRLEAERAVAQVAAARDLNRLLMSLLAHDLRAPLTLANEALTYTEGAVARAQPVDTALLGDVRARLRRSLRALEVTLTVARAEAARDAATAAVLPAPPRSTVRLHGELRAEIDAFAHEAAERRKTIVADLALLPDVEYLVDVLVVRQALAILLDNAIRYAAPGEVRVHAELAAGGLLLRVSDPGPAAAASPWPDGRPAPGLGLGLELCRALAAYAGGSLQQVHGDARGTTFELRLPIEEGAPG